jgi:two-component system, chemotaxis family, sensor histidine kinase and response regulator PixL
MSLNPIRDQAYQCFQQEALELLQTLETGLLTLKDDFTIPKVHTLMRAAHSIKGGAASVGLPGIQKIAHKLEDVLRALYRREGVIDPDLDEALLLAYDCLRVPLQTQISTGCYDEANAWSQAEPIFTLLETFLSEDLGANIELPTAAELGVDIVYEVFTGDVTQGLARLERVLADPQTYEVRGEIYTTAEVFIGIGELLSLPGFAAIGQQILQALQTHPEASLTIGKLAVDNLRAAQQAVLAGDRTEGGSPSDELRALANTSLDLSLSELPIVASLPDPAMREWITDAVELDLANLWAEPSLSEQELGALDQLTQDFASSQPADPLAAASDPTVAALIDLFTAPQNPLPDPPEEVFGPVECQPAIDLDAEAFALQHDLALLPAVPENIVPKASDCLLLAHADAANSVAPTTERVTAIERQAISLKPPERSPHPATPPMSESVRVDSTRLERINNLVGELVTQENGSLLQSQQLQGQLKALQKRFNRFEHLTKELETWMDQSQRVEVRGQPRSQTLSQANLNLGLGQQSPPQKTPPLSSDPDSARISLNFDPLQMDSYSDLYTIVQASVEEIFQMTETMRDLMLITQQSQQTQRKKQQTLKQVRNDLLWARMMPVGDILVRFPRMIRDLSNQYQKQVKFTQTGGFTLIDKSMVEKLYDPLVHLVRNAFDHGVEMPEIRLANGKPAEAMIEIRAYHRGNQTFIEVSDDGRGIDLEKVRAATITQGLFSAAEAAVANSELLYQSLFAPSFSTATVVSELSGRGMGLSAVQNQVKALKGNLTLTSEVNQGTTFTIRLPLTLSIAKLLVFSVNSHYMAISVDSLSAIVTVLDTDIQTIQGQKFYHYEDQLIPLYPTSAFVHHYPLPRGATGQLQSIPLPQQNRTPLLLIDDGDSLMALEVDQIINEQELVIKPFGALVAPPTYLYGCTILGDGSLIPVIDGAVLISQWQDPTSGEFTPRTGPQPPLIGQFAPTLESSPILVIDDSLTTRQNLTLTLHKAGYEVIQAGNGREALEKLRQEPRIQAIFCDVEMPIMNGFEFLNACRKQTPPINLPIIMLSSRSSEKHRGMAKLLGASDYLTKPYLEQGLLATLQECLNA